MMKKRFLAALVLPMMLAACASNDSNNEQAQTMTNQTDIAAQNWVLTKIDNQAISTEAVAPNLMLSEDLNANGNAGCNRFFGQAELKDGNLRIEKMGLTMMACQGPGMEMETVVSKTLMDWSAASVSGDELTLKGQAHSLTFTRADAE
ncbi:META domain-containing protein [Photobacterium aphoticum]|nr:META domain-containing protein [Photobacterium aphoticum]GHA52047.1 heat-shock protein HslJ [Photobacterium aphoticum]